MDRTISNNARERKYLPPSASISKIQQLKDAKSPIPATRTNTIKVVLASTTEYLWLLSVHLFEL